MDPELMVAQLRDVAQRLGRGGLAAGALLALALVLGLVAGPRLAADNRAARAALALDRARLDQSGAAARTRPSFDPADPAAAVLEQLPPADQLAAFVDALQAQATHRGVAIERTEYRVQPVLGQRAVRTQLVLPAHGGYPQLRGWLEATLHDFPSAALEQLALRRSSDGSAALDAEVVLAFYARGAR